MWLNVLSLGKRSGGLDERPDLTWSIWLHGC